MKRHGMRVGLLWLLATGPLGAQTYPAGDFL